jgi:hypothetical protein
MGKGSNLVTINLDQLVELHRTSKWWQFVGKVERFFNYLKPNRIYVKLIKYPYQKLTRGFSDVDAWNADMYLSRQIAGLLRWHIKNSHGVGYPYTTNESTVDEAAHFRNLDYEKYAKMFDELSTNGIAFNKKWKQEFGGLTEKEYKDTMKWFAKIYPGLWD